MAAETEIKPRAHFLQWIEMQDYEKLGVFYLGKEYDLSARKRSGSLLLYESKVW